MVQFRNRCWSGACISLAIVVTSVTGCSNGMSSVSGTVTLDGQPIEGGPDYYGTVSFYREGGGGAPAIGIIKGAGRYTLATGAQHSLEPGTYLVGVAVKKILPPESPGGLTRPQQYSPMKYASPSDSGFKADVKPGNNTFDFALQSK